MECKLPAVFSETILRSDVVDKILVHVPGGESMKEFDALLEVLKKGVGKKKASAPQEGKRRARGRGRGRGGGGGGVKKGVVDLRSLLIHCAQSVAADDSRCAGQLLKQIRQHSTPFGDGNQRLAHCFANGLEARLAGTGSHIYKGIVSKPRSAAAVLKAHQLFLTYGCAQGSRRDCSESYCEAKCAEHYHESCMGVKINASIKKDLVNQFESFLSQGSSKILINFSLSPSCGSYRTAIHPYKYNTPRKTISEMVASNQVEQCIVMCSIAAIDSNMGWYYLSCKVCSKKVMNVPNDIIDDGEEDDELGFHYYCGKCNVKNPKLMPRYKLHLAVLENTGNAKFLLFDNLAVQLLHIPCLELTGANIDMQDPADLPLALKDLVGKTYLFKLGIKKENYLYKNGTYKVLKIVTNIDMITEFEVLSQPKGGVKILDLENSVISDAPEGSLMLSGASSEEAEFFNVVWSFFRGS